jgi:hypothetical protein
LGQKKKKKDTSWKRTQQQLSLNGGCEIAYKRKKWNVAKV